MTPLPAKNKTLLRDCGPHFLAIASCLCMALTTKSSVSELQANLILFLNLIESKAGVAKSASWGPFGLNLAYGLNSVFELENHHCTLTLSHTSV